MSQANFEKFLQIKKLVAADASKENFTQFKELVQDILHIKVEGISIPHLCIISNNFPAYKYLINLGVSYTYPFPDSTPQLSMAILCNAFEIFEFLITKEADPLTGNSQGQTPIHIAASVPDIRYLKLLFTLKEAQEMVLDYQDSTPLHSAVASQNVPAVEFLLGKNIIIDFINKFGEKPYDLALRNQNKEILNLLQAAFQNPLLLSNHNVPQLDPQIIMTQRYPGPFYPYQQQYSNYFPSNCTASSYPQYISNAYSFDSKMIPTNNQFHFNSKNFISKEFDPNTIPQKANQISNDSHSTDQFKDPFNGNNSSLIHSNYEENLPKITVKFSSVPLSQRKSPMSKSILRFSLPPISNSANSTNSTNSANSTNSTNFNSSLYLNSTPLSPINPDIHLHSTSQTPRISGGEEENITHPSQSLHSKFPQNQINSIKPFQSIQEILFSPNLSENKKIFQIQLFFQSHPNHDWSFQFPHPSKQSKMTTCLVYCAEMGHFRLLQELYLHNPPLLSFDSESNSVLHQLFFSECPKNLLIGFFPSQSPILTHKNENGDTPLHLLLSQPNYSEQSIHEILSKSYFKSPAWNIFNNQDMSPFMCFLENKNISFSNAKTVFSKILVCIDPKTILETNRKNQTLLHSAAKGGIYQFVQDLLYAGISPDIVDTDGNFAHDYAITNSFDRSANELYQRIHRTSLDKTSLLSKSISKNCPIMVTTLIRELDSIGIQDSRGELFSKAFYLNNYQIAFHIFKIFAYPNFQNRSGGNSFCHIACEIGNLEIFNLCLDFGADLNLLNAQSKTPLELLNLDSYNDYIRFQNACISHGISATHLDILKKKIKRFAESTAYDNSDDDEDELSII